MAGEKKSNARKESKLTVSMIVMLTLPESAIASLTLTMARTVPVTMTATVTAIETASVGISVGSINGDTDSDDDDDDDSESNYDSITSSGSNICNNLEMLHTLNLFSTQVYLHTTSI